MIVRNDAAVIGRCLASALPLIDSFVIIDTGSTDETITIAWEMLAGLQGLLVSRPWVGAGHNRSEALALARSRADYALLMEPGDELLIPDGWTRPPLAADSYRATVRAPSAREPSDHDGGEQRTLLVSNALVWRYVGVLYEVLVCAQARTGDQLTLGLHHDARTGRGAARFRDDATVLAKALNGETDPWLRARYAFYLAQSYRDCGDRDKALAAYLHRATLGGADEEVFVSLYEAGRQMEALDHDVDLTLATYRRATETCATRAEAAHAASRLCRLRERHDEGYAIAQPALALDAPRDGLQVESWIYRHGLRDEFAVNAYWSGHYHDCLEACRTLLARDDLSDGDRTRFEMNARFAQEKIAELPDAAAETAAGSVVETAVDALRRRLGPALDAVDLRVDAPDGEALDTRPIVLWVRDDVDAPAVQWLRDRDLVARVDRFVFPSVWRMGRFIERFALRVEQCLVIHPALDAPASDRVWRSRLPFQIAYIGAADDGLVALLDALDHLGPLPAEVHIWLERASSGDDDGGDDEGAVPALRSRARRLPNVEWHDDSRNGSLRETLVGCSFLVCPGFSSETSQAAVLEAMASGCRVIGASRGALPETVGIFGRLYPATDNPHEHAALLAGVLLEEVSRPWGGRTEQSIEQQHYVRATCDWGVRATQWLTLLETIERRRRRDVTVPALPASSRRTVEALARLRDRGFSPSGIIDAGARDGAFARAARRVYPDAHLLLIDGDTERTFALEALCRETENAEIVTAWLGARDKRGKRLFTRPWQAKAPPQRALGGLIGTSGRSFGLLRLAVGGGELDLLKGIGAHLDKIEVILLRMSLLATRKDALPLDAMLASMKTMGFALCDLVEEHRDRDGGLMRVDGLFLRPLSHYHPRAARPT